MKKNLLLSIILLLTCAITNVKAQWMSAGCFSGTKLANNGTIIFSDCQGMSVSLDSGSTWTQANNGLPGGGFVLSLGGDGSTMYAGLSLDGIYTSTNNGVNWAPANTGISTGTNGIYPQSFAFAGTNVFSGIWDAPANSGIYSSTNSGANWTDNIAGLPGTQPFYVPALAVSGSNLFAAISNDLAVTMGYGVYLSVNNGSSWTAVNTGLTNQNVTSLTVKGTNIFAGTNGGGVFLSSNNGGNWTAVNNGLTNTTIYSLANDGTNIFAGTGFHVYFSTDNGATWTATSGGPNATVALLVHGTKIFAADSGLVWKRALSDFSTSIRDISDINIATLFPNPSKGKFVLTIKDRQSKVNIDVYNTKGETVYTSMMEVKRNNFSKEINLAELANGVYYIQITSGSKSFTKKIVINK